MSRMLRDVGIQRHFQESGIFLFVLLLSVLLLLLLLLLSYCSFSVLDTSLAIRVPSVQLQALNSLVFSINNSAAKHDLPLGHITRCQHKSKAKMLHRTKTKDSPPSPAEEAEIALEANDVEVDAQTQKRIMRKLDLRIIPMVMWM